MGMHATYLEAGSGARQAVDRARDRPLRERDRRPAARGWRHHDAARRGQRAMAGRDYVVVGTLFERRRPPSQPLASAARA
jgi:heptaprenylglyceryl phosphate synthase